MSRKENESTLYRLTLLIGIVVGILACCSGCTTVVPVTVKFPASPGEQAMQRCPDLKKLNESTVLSNIAETVADNYGTYYECSVKNDTWIEWYNIQKRIFENAAK